MTSSCPSSAVVRLLSSCLARVQLARLRTRLNTVCAVLCYDPIPLGWCPCLLLDGRPSALKTSSVLSTCLTEIQGFTPSSALCRARSRRLGPQQPHQQLWHPDRSGRSHADGELPPANLPRAPTSVPPSRLLSDQAMHVAHCILQHALCCSDVVQCCRQLQSQILFILDFRPTTTKFSSARGILLCWGIAGHLVVWSWHCLH